MKKYFGNLKAVEVDILENYFLTKKTIPAIIRIRALVIILKAGLK